MRRLPVTALLLGLGGLIPFVFCGWEAAAAYDSAAPSYWLLALCGYGAVILSFLGGVQWGLALDAPPAVAAAGMTTIVASPRRNYRLVLGVLASLGGWAALLVMLAGWSAIALALLIAGFLLFVSAESELRNRGLMPAGYIVMRWGLTVVVVAVLGTVLVLRLIGVHISF